MPTVKLVDENTTEPRVRAVFDDIKAVRKVEHISAIWRALAANPEHLELCWAQVKSIMKPGVLDMKTKEMIAVAVSITNGCNYCINSHLAAAQKFGLDAEGMRELLAVVGLYNQFNKLVFGLQIEPDVFPQVEA